MNFLAPLHVDIGTGCTGAHTHTGIEEEEHLL